MSNKRLQRTAKTPLPRHWKQDPATGLWSLKEDGSFKAMAQAFSDAHARVSSDPAVYAAIQTKIYDALAGWAIVKMGPKRSQYTAIAVRNFGILCAQIVANTGRDVRDVAEEALFEFPLHLNKKRSAFTDQIPDIYLTAAEYEEVLGNVRSAKAKTKTHAALRLSLAEILKPLPRNFEKKLSNYYRSTSPSRIALDYVGCKHGVTGAKIKKLLVLARDPDRMSQSLRKYLQRSYLPKNLEEIKRSLAL